MKNKKRHSFYRFMFQKSVMPLLLLLVIFCMAFLLFFRLMLIRDHENRHVSNLRRLQTCVSFTELQMKEIEKWGVQLLNGVTLQRFLYMYEDLDWYSRFELQNEIYGSLYDLCYRNEQIASVILYISSMDKAITDLHCQTSVKPWMKEMEEGEDRTCILEDGRVVTSIHWEGDGESTVLMIVWKEQGIMNQINALFLSGDDSIECIWAPTEPDVDTIFADSQYYPFRMVYEEKDDKQMEHFVVMIAVFCGLFMGVCLILVIISIRKWHKQLYRPLYRLLVEAFDHIEKNDFGYRIELENDNVFFHSIYDKYNHMAETMQQYIETNLRQQILVSQSNLKQLQSQISPHFMYNSYYVLYRMIRKGDNENSLRLAEYLGSFYHYITRNSDDEKRLSEEVEHAKNYARIQQFRFRENLDFFIDDLDPQIADIYVPRLILQPILENAFKYAYENGNGDPIKLRIGYEIISRNQFYIVIENSGDIEETLLEELRNKLRSTDMQIETTAMININRRLQLYFGEHSGMSVDRSELGGLKVTMKIWKEKDV